MSVAEFPCAFRALAMALTDIAFERSERAESAAHDSEASREAMSQALLYNGFARALFAAASGIETEGQDREDGLGAEHESPTSKAGDAQ